MPAPVGTLTLHTCALCKLRKGILVDVAASGCHMETGTQEEILEMTLHHLLVMRHQLVEELGDRMSTVRDGLTDTLTCFGTLTRSMKGKRKGAILSSSACLVTAAEAGRGEDSSGETEQGTL